MKKLMVGGVPEHFNFPWTWAQHEKRFSQKNIDFRWKDYPKGTGDLSKALRKKELDVAVILTEGIVRDIVNGNPSKIVQTYVESPLIWGIHVAKNSAFQNVEDLKGMRAAISRFGSGSHLMAYVNAEKHQWNPEKDLKFEVVDDLDGALKSLPKEESDYFMWEKFMTKPFVDNGIFRLIGETPTPWPSFVIAVRNDILESNEHLIRSLLEIINSITSEFKNYPKIDKHIAEQFQQKPEDVQKWLSLTEWSQNQLHAEEVVDIQNKLFDLNLIENTISPEEILHSF